MTEFYGNTACLLLHGYAGSTFEIEPLKKRFEELGISIAAPLLPGHGKTIEDLHQTGFEDWYRVAEEALLDLKEKSGRVFVVGQSMGGTLGLALAASHAFAGLVAVGAPVFLYRFFPPMAVDWRLPLVGLLKHVRPFWNTSVTSAESRRIAPWEGYDGVQALRPLHSFLKGITSVRKKIERVSCPLLLLHSPKDRLCPVESSYEILSRVSSRSRRLELLPIRERITSHHVLTTHEETRELVQELVLDFIDPCSQS